MTKEDVIARALGGYEPGEPIPEHDKITPAAVLDALAEHADSQHALRTHDHIGPAWAPHQPQINLPHSIDRMRPLHVHAKEE